jgi:hypothetical protein
MAKPVLRAIRASDYIDQAWPLLEAHRDELTTNKAIMVLDPMRERYAMLDDCGALLTVGAFIDDEIVGYSVNIIDHNLHYQGLLVCQNDILFVRKDLRGRLGLQLMHETERLAKERAGELPILQLWHAKPNTDLEAILPRQGYKVQDLIFSKVL